jgi:hypothetical protein
MRPVGAHAADRLLQDLEAALLDRQPVQEDDVQHDPADGKEPGTGIAATSVDSASFDNGL